MKTIHDIIVSDTADTPPENMDLTPPTVWDYWPMPDHEPRKSQVIALEKMAELPAHKKYIMCEIPVGGGKSPIALTYAGFLGHGLMGSSYILTPQRVLQRQYEESFDGRDLTSVYGKANYYCHTKVGLDCDIANDMKPECDRCPAKEAFKGIVTHPHAVLNYKLALLYSEIFPGDDPLFPVKDLMVFDECHTLENNLVNHRAVAITERRCEKMQIPFSKPTNVYDAHEWVRDVYYPAVNDLFTKLENQVADIDDKYGMSHAKMLPSEIQVKKEYKEVHHYRKLVKYISERDAEYMEEYYVLVTDKDKFEFKEIYGGRLFDQILRPKANRFLFMSSTILNFEAYASDLGIPVEETATISLPSEFDPENRPVYFMPKAKMAYGWQKPENAPLRDDMSKGVLDLCKIHADDSGIIHTGSFQIAKWLVGEIRDKVDHKILTHFPEDGIGRDECIEDFMNNEGKVPTLLISPSVTEGLDLKDDIARFAIFVKVPYPFLGDEWVKRRLDLSEEWYKRQAMTAIIQGGGRIVRSETDWGNTYILDSSFGQLWNRFKRLTPEWWKEAFTKTK